MNITLEELSAKIDALLARESQPQKRFLGVDEAADYISHSDKTVRRLIAAGKLTALRPCRGRVVVDRLELDSFVLGSATHPRSGRGRS